MERTQAVENKVTGIASRKKSAPMFTKLAPTLAMIKATLTDLNCAVVAAKTTAKAPDGELKEVQAYAPGFGVEVAKATPELRLVPARTRLNAAHQVAIASVAASAARREAAGRPPPTWRRWWQRASKRAIAKKIALMRARSLLKQRGWDVWWASRLVTWWNARLLSRFRLAGKPTPSSGGGEELQVLVRLLSGRGYTTRIVKPWSCILNRRCWIVCRGSTAAGALDKNTVAAQRGVLPWHQPLRDVWKTLGDFPRHCALTNWRARS